MFQQQLSNVQAAVEARGVPPCGKLLPLSDIFDQSQPCLQCSAQAFTGWLSPLLAPTCCVTPCCSWQQGGQALWPKRQLLQLVAIGMQFLQAAAAGPVLWKGCQPVVGNRQLRDSLQAASGTMLKLATQGQLLQCPLLWKLWLGMRRSL